MLIMHTYWPFLATRSLSVLKYQCHLSEYAISEKTKQPKSIKWPKTLLSVFAEKNLRLGLWPPDSVQNKPIFVFKLVFNPWNPWKCSRDYILYPGLMITLKILRNRSFLSIETLKFWKKMHFWCLKGYFLCPRNSKPECTDRIKYLL